MGADVRVAVAVVEVRQETGDRLTGDLTPSATQLCEFGQTETRVQRIVLWFEGLVQRQAARSLNLQFDGLKRGLLLLGVHVHVRRLDRLYGGAEGRTPLLAKWLHWAADRCWRQCLRLMVRALALVRFGSSCDSTTNCTVSPLSRPSRGPFP